MYKINLPYEIMLLRYSTSSLSRHFHPYFPYLLHHRIHLSSVSRRILPLYKSTSHQAQLLSPRPFFIPIRLFHYPLHHDLFFRWTRWHGVRILNTRNTMCLSASPPKESCPFGTQIQRHLLVWQATEGNGSAPAQCLPVERTYEWRDAAPRKRLSWVR